MHFRHLKDVLSSGNVPPAEKISQAECNCEYCGRFNWQLWLFVLPGSLYSFGMGDEAWAVGSHKQPLSLERLFTIVAMALKMNFFLRVGRRVSLHGSTGLRGSTDDIFVHRHAWIVDSFVLTFL